MKKRTGKKKARREAADRRLMPNGLTPIQDRFVLEYLKDCNATQAAIRAGYRVKGARVQGVRLLTNALVAQIIGKEQERLKLTARLDADRLQQEAERIAISDIRRLVKDGMLLRLQDIPDDLAPAIASIELVTKSLGEGEVEHLAKIRFWDKPAAIRTLLQLQGKLNDKNLNIKGELTLADARKQVEEAVKQMNPEELAEFIALKERAVALQQKALGR